MANSVQLEVITPEKLFYKGEIELVIVRTLTGDEGFMAKHAWACKLLDVGEMWIREKGKEEFRIAAIANGYIDVKDSIVIYTDAAEWQEEIDPSRAAERKATMEAWLNQNLAGEADPNEIARAKISIAKQATRMNVAAGGARRKR